MKTSSTTIETDEFDTLYVNSENEVLVVVNWDVVCAVLAATQYCLFLTAHNVPVIPGLGQEMLDS